MISKIDERSIKMKNAIEINNLTKVYESSKKALDDLSLIIPQGEIFGFLGPNGSGKTTTVRLLNGILTPTGGHGSILGNSISGDLKKLHSICGVMTETAAAYENLTASENLSFFGNMHNMAENDIKNRTRELLEALDLYDSKDVKVKSFSTGMKKRISLAIAMFHRPRVLFLDEPTSGLDPEAALKVTNIINNMSKQEGVTVFLCTHQLKYAEDICTLYGFIQKGNLLAYGRFEELLKKKHSSLFLEVRGENFPVLKKLTLINNNVGRITIKSDEDAAEVLKTIIQSGAKIYEAKQIQWNLEELYFSYLREEI
jgi:ABC-2 type transport system ATP-binding protein